MLEKTIQRRAVVTYRLAITDDIDVTYPDGTRGSGYRTVGYRVMECEIDIEIDLAAIVKEMGAAACCNRTGKSRDGKVLVRKSGTPKEIGREMREPIVTRSGGQ